MLKPSNKLIAYLRKAEELGLSPERILAGSGVSWHDADSLKTIDQNTTAVLFDYLARRTPPEFALLCGKASKIIDFGIVGLVMSTAPYLRDAFDYWARYSLAAAQPFTTTICETPTSWKMRFGSQRLLSPEAQRFCLEASIAAHETTIQELTGSPPNTLAIDFDFDRPASIAQYDLLLTSQIRFSRPATVYHGQRSDLDRRLPAGDREMTEAFQQEFDRFIAQIESSQSIREKIENIIRKSAGKIPSTDEMAHILGLSRRTFQRELQRNGTAYQDIIRDFRVREAMNLLDQGQFNVKRSAFVLGFANAGSFRRAFREWTGQSVAEWKSGRSQA